MTNHSIPRINPNLSHPKHGRWGTPEYWAWHQMKQRCQNPNDPSWDHYGGRGIIVYARWKEFANFYEDLGPRPSPKHTLERVDNSKGYIPSNVKWATRREQNNNTRRNHLLTFQGETRSISQWARRLGISKNTLLKRIRMGWTTEKTLTTEVQEEYRRPTGGRKRRK